MITAGVCITPQCLRLLPPDATSHQVTLVRRQLHVCIIIIIRSCSCPRCCSTPYGRVVWVPIFLVARLAGGQVPVNAPQHQLAVPLGGLQAARVQVGTAW